MTLNKWILLGAALLLMITPTWADNVYYGGFKDLVDGDYDYQDLVFTVSGPALTIVIPNGDGGWFPEPVLGTDDNPFWNNLSSDGPNENIGNCIYGGNCPAPAGATGLAPNDRYLALNSGPLAGIASVGDVYFDGNGESVTIDVLLHIAADTDVLGWYPVGSPGSITLINSGATETGVSLTFTPPDGEFGLVGENLTTGQTFYSNIADGGTSDTSPHQSHFAFFGVPEPGSMVLFGTALLGLSVMLRRRKNAQ